MARDSPQGMSKGLEAGGGEGVEEKREKWVPFSSSE